MQRKNDKQTIDQQAIDTGRRRLLKASAFAGGSLVAGTLPYEKPAVKSFFGTRSAWAQATGVLEISFSGQLGTLPPGTPDGAAGKDLWEFEVQQSNTTLTIVATPDGNLDPEIFLFPPGPVALGDTNLLAGNPFGLDTAGVGGVESTTVTVAAAGVYSFAIEDQRSPANQVAGLYSVTITGNKPLLGATLVEDEGPEADLGTGDSPGQ